MVTKVEKPEPLDALAAAADAVEAASPQLDAAGQVMPGPAEPEGPNNFGAIAFLMAATREVLGKVLQVESLKETLKDRNCEECARVLAPVADKYGINLGGYMRGPEFVALLTAGPILWTAWDELNRELAARRKKPGQVEAAEVPPVAAAVET